MEQVNINQRRKKYFIEESFQGKYLFSYLIVAVLVMVFFTLLFIYFSTDTLSITYDGNNRAIIGKTPEIMMKSIFGIHGILILACAVAILFFVTRFTHRTAGPLLKIGQSIDFMIQGDLGRSISLRKNDECWELADKINHLNAVMHNRLREIDLLANEIDRALDELNTGGIQDQSAQDSLDSLKHRSRKLRHSLAFFRLYGNGAENRT